MSNIRHGSPAEIFSGCLLRHVLAKAVFGRVAGLWPCLHNELPKRLVKLLQLVLRVPVPSPRINCKTITRCSVSPARSD